MQISLVLPTYNQEEHLDRTLKMYDYFFKQRNEDFELIVVCSACTDNSVGIAKHFAGEWGKEHTKVIVSELNLGKGGAVRKGFQEAVGEWIGFLDPDSSVTPRQFKKLIREMRVADGAIASRRLRDSRIVIKQPWWRRYWELIVNPLIRLVFSLPFRDTQCGAKLFKKKAVKEVLPLLNCTGFEFDVELLWKIKKLGFGIVEVPVIWKHRSGSRFRLRYWPSMVWGLLKIRLLG